MCIDSAASSSDEKSYSDKPPADENLFCGVCFIDCGEKAYQEGCRWQAYGDWTLHEKKWVYLCSGCNKYFWRLFSKDEYPEEDWKRQRKDYMLFVKNEMECAKKLLSP